MIYIEVVPEAPSVDDPQVTVESLASDAFGISHGGVLDVTVMP
ncbi:hypothetical protein [Mesorhizobium sp. M0859]